MVRNQFVNFFRLKHYTTVNYHGRNIYAFIIPSSQHRCFNGIRVVMEVLMQVDRSHIFLE